MSWKLQVRPNKVAKKVSKLGPPTLTPELRCRRQPTLTAQSGREDELAGGSRRCTSELEAAAQLLGNVDELKTLIVRVEDTHTIGSIGHEDDHANSSRSCTSELEIAAQLRGNVDEPETHIARVEDTHILGAPGL